MDIMKLQQMMDVKFGEMPLAGSGNTVKRERIRDFLILLRMMTREAIREYTKARGKLRALEREQRKLKEKGITFLCADAFAEQFRNSAEYFKSLIVLNGGMTEQALNLWELSGATLHDLCDLCGLDYGKVKAGLGEDAGDSLSKIMFSYGLDYAPHDKTDFIDFEYDGPFTHATKEYMLHWMLHTQEGREASDRALQETMPELWESAMLLNTDEDGNQYLTDWEGNPVSLE